MQIVRVEGATRELGKPAEWGEDQKCLTLPVKDTVLEDGSKVMVSAWQPSQEELAQLAADGHVYLWVWGQGHPPVAITVAGAEHKGTMMRGPGGALVCDREIEGVTQKLDADSARFYGGPYMLAETVTLGAARVIAAAMGFRLQE